MADRIVIYGEHRSGNCLKVKWTADKLGLAYEWREVDVVGGETRTPEYLAINPAGQVPCMMREDGRMLAQSNAIMIFLAQNSDLIPEDAFDKAKMLEWMFWEQYSHEPFIAVRRFRKVFQKLDDEAIDPDLFSKGRRALGVMAMRLMDRDFIVRDRLTLADVALVAYTRVADEGGFDLDEFPEVRAWVHRVENEMDIDPQDGRISAA